MASTQWVLRGISLFAGCCILFVCNTARLYSAIKLDWEQLMHEYMSKEKAAEALSTIYSITAFGYFVVIAGLLFDRIGSLVTMIYGTALASVGNFTVALTMHGQKSAIFYGICRMVTLQGCQTMSFLAVWLNGKIWPLSLTAAVNGTLLSCFSIGALVLVRVYRSMGANPALLYHYVAVITVSVYIVAGLILVLASSQYIRQFGVTKASTEAQSESAPVVEKPVPSASESLFRIEVLGLCSTYLFVVSPGMVFGGMLTTILKSLGTPPNSLLFFLQLHVFFELSSRIVIGITTDMVAKYFTKPQVISFLIIMNATGQVIHSYLAASFNAFAIVSMASSYAGLYALLPAYAREVSASERFGLVSSISFACVIPSNFFYSYIFPHLEVATYLRMGATLCVVPLLVFFKLSCRKTTQEVMLPRDTRMMSVLSTSSYMPDSVVLRENKDDIENK